MKRVREMEEKDLEREMEEKDLERETAKKQKTIGRRK